MKQFAKEFWPRMFWGLVLLVFVILFLYVTAPTMQF